MKVSPLLALVGALSACICLATVNCVGEDFRSPSPSSEPDATPAASLDAASSVDGGEDAAPTEAGADGGADADAGPFYPPSCFDNEKSPEETAIDCGGPCPRCAVGRECLIPSDCASNECLGECTNMGGSFCGSPQDCTGSADCIHYRCAAAP